MDKNKDVDVVVIGAGVTGLVTSFLLTRKGLKVLLLEKNNRVGGQMRSIREDGFVFESGPNTGVVSNPEVVELFQMLQGSCSIENARKEAKVRLIWKNGAFHPLPSNLSTAVSTPLFTWNDKIRILFEPFRKKGDNPFESIGELTRRRLGQSFLDYAVDPFISGIYAGDPSKLVTRFALPKLYNLEQKYGSFIRGAIKKAGEPKSDRDKLPTKEVFSVPGGFESLATALAKEIKEENIYLSQKGISIQPVADGWETVLSASEERIHSRYVVSTAAAYDLPTLLPFIAEKDMKPISSLHYAPVIQVGVGVVKADGHVPNAFGGLVPSREKQRMLGILFPSSCFSDRCPKGGGNLSFFIGGSKHPEYLSYTDEQLESLVKESLSKMLGFPANYTPDKIKIFRHERAIPQYEADTEERLASIAGLEKQYSGLFFAGGIKDGIGMADRIKQATRIAEEIANLN